MYFRQCFNSAMHPTQFGLPTHADTSASASEVLEWQAFATMPGLKPLNLNHRCFPIILSPHKKEGQLVWQKFQN